MGGLRSSRRFFWLLFALLLIWQPGLLPAQIQRGSFRSLTTADGLPSGRINALHQGESGFIWIGTHEGLVRYDGLQMIQYKDELSNSRVLSILEDPDGSVWVSTRNGLNHLNPWSRECTHYLSGEDGFAIAAIHRDRAGTLWLATDAGLLPFDPHVGVEDPDFDSGPTELNDRLIWKIHEDDEGVLWLAGLRSFIRFDPRSEAITEYHYDPWGVEEEDDPWFNGIAEDDAGVLWIGHDAYGLLRFDPRTEEFQHFLPWDDDWFTVSSIEIDDHGLLWCVTFGGLFVFDPAQEKFIEHLDEDWQLELGLPHFEFYVSERMRNGELWMGDLNAGIKIYDARFSHYMADYTCMPVTEDSQGDLWCILSPDHFVESWNLVQFSEDMTEYTEFIFDPDETAAVYPDYLDGATPAADGNIWLMLDESGPTLFDTAQGIVRQPLLAPDHPLMKLGPGSPVFEDSRGSVWFNTEESGFVRFDPDDSSYVIYPVGEGPGNILDPWIWGLFEDSRGDIWFHKRADLSVYSYGTDSFMHYIDVGNPDSDKGLHAHLAETADGDIWIVSIPSGLNKFDRDTGTFEYYGLETGFPTPAPDAVFVAGDNTLWVGGDNPAGARWVIHYDPERKLARTYDERDGVRGNFPYPGGLETSRGEYVFGGPGGLTLFNPEDVLRSDVEPQLFIRNIRVNDEPIRSDTVPWDLQDLSLSWRENDLIIELANLDIVKADTFLYAYTLEGYDEDWIYTEDRYFDAQRRWIEFNNLPGGKYTFKALSTDRYGAWPGEDEALALNLLVEPHPLRRWWAITLYLLLAGAAALGIYVITRAAGRRQLALQRAETERQRAVADRLTQLDRVKDRFLANTSHELRTPLHGMVGLAESLREGVAGELPPKARHSLDLISSSGKRLANLVNDILDFTKLRERDLGICPKPVNVRRLAEITLALSSHVAAKKGLELVNAVPAELPSASADETRLQQILHNLVGNAVKFTDSGSVTVGASQEDGMIQIRVSDTGIGIDPADQERIFAAFEQSEETGQLERGGTGLGLSISRQLVNLHGGEIQLDSEPGAGSTFSFTIPATDEPADEAAEPVSRRNAAEPIIDVRVGEWQGAGDVRILVVDDEPVNLQVVSDYLAMNQFQVVQATNGEEAIQVCTSEPRPDIILLDIMMPRVNGYEVCEQIRRAYPANELPVIMLTAKNQVEDLVESLGVGANDFISKPFSKRELLARIRTHLELSKINIAAGRFVPNEFIRLLNKESIIDLRLGDQIEKDMTIMFSDIRSFTELCESMTPEDTFNFLNSYLKRMVPVIHDNGGFVDKYIGDGVMALFPDDVDHAMHAAIRMQQAVSEFNTERGAKHRLPIRTGIGLHSGKTILGAIGAESRWDETVVSDVVNLSSRIEGLTKRFGAPIIVSERTKSLVSSAASYSFRLLGRVQVKGKSQPTIVYELLDGNSPERLEKKIKTRHSFEKGLDLFYRRDFGEAIVRFTAVLGEDPADRAAAVYRDRAATFVITPPPEDWGGVEVMVEK